MEGVRLISVHKVRQITWLLLLANLRDEERQQLSSFTRFSASLIGSPCQWRNVNRAIQWVIIFQGKEISQPQKHLRRLVGSCDSHPQQCTMDGDTLTSGSQGYPRIYQSFHEASWLMKGDIFHPDLIIL
ncbi:uncharacterized protein PADG_02541 [Paracoccidioides brasiliensis Pb18]|uniref:Uncharacterized protein n=1 Tax=Paracoccidioides brasiliensis (strain Pb18) TaxID=502780 RepID=C1G5T6_PARBD|nr:uncharacterized protein PADG_02541 [Paracoccidioides brasiliensis Pb18]EEH46443.2 hypothetical protein PADG_02541 [Paracoccidioides brasiliensis Pb18]